MARIKIRARTAAQWAALNEVLLARELGFETDTRKYKLGDGVTRWNSLPYGGGIATGGAWGTITGSIADQAD